MYKIAYKQKKKSKWVVLPAELARQKRSSGKKLTSRMLRSAISQSWRGAGAVNEIRAQRKRAGV